MDIKFEPPRGNIEAWCRRLAEDLNMAFESLENSFSSEVSDLLKESVGKNETIQSKLKEIESSSALASFPDANGQSF